MSVQITVYLYGMPMPRRSFASGGSYIIVFVSLLSYIQTFSYNLFHNHAFHLHDGTLLTEDKKKGSYNLITLHFLFFWFSISPQCHCWLLELQEVNAGDSALYCFISSNTGRTDGLVSPLFRFLSLTGNLCSF